MSPDPHDEPAVDVRDAFCLHPLPDGGAVAALRGLSLTVRAGERLVVQGPNGSGKTTLLRALIGEQRLAAGHARVAGLDLATAGSRQLAHWRANQLGQVDQEAGRLLRPEFDVLDNVALQLRITGVSRSVAGDRAGELLERLGLGALARRRPATLSGGQAQRVAVCAALAHQPRLVLADEPTGELDAASADAVYELLAATVAAAGAALVLVTHDRRAEAVADRVVRIRDGRISETWRPATLIEEDADVAAGEAPGVTAGAGRRRESLVVDSRGWVRLPIELRRRLGLGSQLTVQASDGALVLRPDTEAHTVDTDVDPEVAVAVETEVDADAAEARVEASERALPPAQATASRAMPAGRPIVQAVGVVVRYPDRRVLQSPDGTGVDLTVAPGELVVIAGRSGAGKSTLLRVVLGLQDPDEGKVILDGVDLAGCTRDRRAALRAGCSAVVMQRVHLAATTDAIGNLDLARAARGLPAEPAFVARQLDLLGLAGLSHRQVSGLSGGERQRLAVARALAVAPGLLVLDEPTSQLDETSAEVLTAVLREVADAGTAVLVASHDPVLTAAADRCHYLT